MNLFRFGSKTAENSSHKSSHILEEEEEEVDVVSTTTSTTQKITIAEANNCNSFLF